MMTNNDISFLNSYKMVTKKNANDKLTMLNRIKTDYGNLSPSIENYCNSVGNSTIKSTTNLLAEINGLIKSETKGSK